MTNNTEKNNKQIGMIERFVKFLTVVSTIANSLLIIIAFNERIAAIINSPNLGVYLRIAAIFMILSVTYLIYLFKNKWMSLFYILPLFGLLITIHPVEDYWFKKFKKSDIGVIIADFHSPIQKNGSHFSWRLYQQLANKIRDSLTIGIGDTTISIKIQPQRVSEEWKIDEIKIRGRRREADICVVGEYKRYQENGKLKEEIINFKVVLLDTLIANIFEEEKPFGKIYEFIVNIEDISVMQGDSIRVEEKVATPIEYIINMAGNASLLVEAKKQQGWQQDLILSTLHQRINEQGKQIKNRSLACFHLGNSLVRATMNPKLSLEEQQNLLKDASSAYWSSIRRFSLSDSCLLKQYHPERTYLNLIWTYMERGAVPGNSAFKDSAEVVYDSLVVHFPGRKMLEKQHTFLAERCDEVFKVRNDNFCLETAKRLYKKYVACADALEEKIILESPQPKISNQDQIIVDEIAANKKYYETHLKKFQKSKKTVKKLALQKR